MSRQFDPKEVEELIKQSFRLVPAAYFLEKTDTTDIRSAINFVRMAADAKFGVADGWVTWGGGTCPVSANALVEVRYKNGGLGPVTCASRYDWSNDADQCYPISAYRVVKS